MTVARDPLTKPAPSLVLLACGTPASVDALQAQAGPGLAAALALTWAAPLEPLLPDAALTALAPAALVPLPRDPGHPLEDGRHWAEVLGAWRQPALLLIDGAQLQTGLAAAAAALLQQWQVPSLGLVQVGGAWDGDQRRQEGLPWLGWWPAAAVAPAEQLPLAPPQGLQPEEDAQAALLLALRRRWRQQQAALA